jgi:hypothetical protein
MIAINNKKFWEELITYFPYFSKVSKAIPVGGREGP